MINTLFDFLPAFRDSPFFLPYMAFIAAGGLSVLANSFLGGGKND